MSKENIITLIVKGNNATPMEFWVEMNKRGKHSTDGVAQSSVKVVHDNFRT